MAIAPKKIKLSARQKSKFRIRKSITGTDARPRLSVFKSVQHTYAQVISDITGKTIVSASTLEKDVVDATVAIEREGGVKSSRSTKSAAAAFAVGQVLAKRAAERNITQVVFDRNGYVYHGRVQSTADGARKGGLVF